MTIIKIERDEAFTGLASIDNLRATVPEALRAAAVEASEMLRAADASFIYLFVGETAADLLRDMARKMPITLGAPLIPAMLEFDWQGRASAETMLGLLQHT